MEEEKALWFIGPLIAIVVVAIIATTRAEYHVSTIIGVSIFLLVTSPFWLLMGLAIIAHVIGSISEIIDKENAKFEDMSAREHLHYLRTARYRIFVIFSKILRIPFAG